MRKFPRLLVFIFILLCALIAVNFYREYLNTLFSLSPYAIPSLSGAIVIFILFVFFETNRKNEVAINDFMTIVTHKFRTPLTAVKWSTSMLKTEVTNEEKQTLLKRLDQASLRLSEIVDLMVRFSKYDNGLEYAYKATSFRDMVYESLNRLSESVREKGVKLDIAPLTSLPLIVIDEAKIQFAIDSVIDNAVRYTPAGGSIRIWAENKKDTILFAVSDSGIGIPPHDIKKVSRRFFRSANSKRIDTEGLGMSLYTVKSIIRKHGGKLQIESKGENQGTLVTIEIPKNQSV